MTQSRRTTIHATRSHSPIPRRCRTRNRNFTGAAATSRYYRTSEGNVRFWLSSMVGPRFSAVRAWPRSSRDRQRHWSLPGVVVDVRSCRD